MYTLLTPPEAEPLSLTEVKAALRVDHENDDTLLTGMIATARTFLERRLDRAFLTQVWRARWEGNTSKLIPLRPGPVMSVSSVTVTDEVGTESVLNSEDWRLVGGGLSCLQLLKSLPSDELTIDVIFEAGAASAEGIPADLLRAVYLLTAHYYEERELFRQQRYVAVPHGVEALIEAYREVRL